MAMTRANAESILINRCGKTLTLVGLDGTTVNGTNASLVDAMLEGLCSLGLTSAGAAAVTDSDLSQLSTDQYPQFLDVAEIRALETALGNWDEPDQIAGQDNRQDLGKLRESLEKSLDRKSTRAEKLYGYGTQDGVEAGTLYLGFQSQETD